MHEVVEALVERTRGASGLGIERCLAVDHEEVVGRQTHLGFLVTARLGGIVLSRLIKTGGLKFDEAVRQTVRREFNLLIGQKTAATIRQSIGDLEKEGKGAVVYGRDIVVGLPVEREIPTDLINSCLEEHFNTIIVIFFRFFLTTGLIYPSLQ